MNILRYVMYKVRDYVDRNHHVRWDNDAIVKTELFLTLSKFT